MSNVEKQRAEVIEALNQYNASWEKFGDVKSLFQIDVKRIEKEASQRR